MDNVIGEYQKWKQQGDSLRANAKQAMEVRFRELLTEAAHIAQEYHADFGASLKPPPSITAFRFKTGKPGKGKPVGRTNTTAKGKAAPVAAPVEKPDASPKVVALQKRLAAAKKKLDAAKTAGTPTRNLEDKVYEIEDELQLAMA